MTIRRSLVAIPGLVLLVAAVWGAAPRTGRAGEDDAHSDAHGAEAPQGHHDMHRDDAHHAEEDAHAHGGSAAHVHVAMPLAYADFHPAPGVWTDAATLARGRAIHEAKCAACHGMDGDGRGPAAVALPLRPPDLRDRDAVAEMRDNYWFWRVSEGGAVEPFRSRGSAMPAWKGELSVEDRWAVIAYQHTFSGHAGAHAPWEHPEMVRVGRDVFAMSCVPCHGRDGRGDGSVGATLSPRRSPQPRDFTRGLFKLRSTPTGELPTTADLFRTVTEGVRAGGGPLTFGLRGARIMPSFAHMPQAQRVEVIEFVKSLDRRFWERRTVAPIVVPTAPAPMAERVDRGRRLYADAECLACHGAGGHGDGPSAPTLRDARDLPIAATDRTRPGRFKNGARPEDVYRTLVTGLAGTPMPSYADALEPEQVWDLVYFVLSLR